MKLVNEEKSWLEWLVFGISTVLIAALLIYLIRDGISDQGRPPELRIELGKPVAAEQGYRVFVKVRNDGDQTAEGLEIEVTGSAVPDEKGTLIQDYLSSGEVQDGWVGFSRDPGEVTARVVGYRAD